MHLLANINALSSFSDWRIENFDIKFYKFTIFGILYYWTSLELM